MYNYTVHNNDRKHTHTHISKDMLRICVSLFFKIHLLSDGDFVWMPWWHRRHALRHLHRREGQHYSCYQSRINNINKNWLRLGIIKSFVCDIGFELLYFYHLKKLYHNLNYTILRVMQYQYWLNIFTPEQYIFDICISIHIHPLVHFNDPLPKDSFLFTELVGLLGQDFTLWC